LSCGVIVSDGARLLLGHATRSARWDIPKGKAEPGEDALAAALRELQEESGLVADAAALRPLGTHVYLPAKDLALFAWFPMPLPDPASLRCTAMVVLPTGRTFPELDRFGLFSFDQAAGMVGRNLVRVLATIRPMLLPAAPP
jgi:8-oxo-dGTP pyrophosphatase MutT (NUDIX family)